MIEENRNKIKRFLENLAVFEITYSTCCKISVLLINLSPPQKSLTRLIEDYLSLKLNLTLESKLHELIKNTLIFHTLTHVL